MRIDKILKTVCVILCGTYAACAGGEKGGGQPGAFLRVGVGSRALGMGGAFVAVADDATASYWNPAGLGLVRELQIGGMYAALSLDRQYNFAGAALPLGAWGTVGASWINFGVKNIDGRDQSGSPTGTFSNNEQALLLAYGVRLLPALALGGGVKLLRHTLAAASAYGYGYDAGLLLMPAPFLTLGASVQNLQTHLAWNTQERTQEIFPQVARFGMQLKPATFLRFSVDYEILSQANGKWRARDAQEGEWRGGGEIWLGKIFGLRAGMNAETPAFGASLVAPAGNSAVEMDYSFAHDRLDATASHRVSLLLKFGKPQAIAPEQQKGRRPAKISASKSSSRSSGTGWLRAQIVEIQTPYLTIRLNRSDLLKPGMKIRLYQLLDLAKVGKFYCLAEVMMVRQQRVMVKLSKAPAFAERERLALKVLPLALKE